VLFLRLTARDRGKQRAAYPGLTGRVDRLSTHENQHTGTATPSQATGLRLRTFPAMRTIDERQRLPEAIGAGN